MSHEYMKCKGCGEPKMEHLMSHTEKGSYCDACYKRLGLEKSDEDLGFKICTVCGEKFLQRNFKTDYPDDVCGICGEAQKAKTDSTAQVRDVPFHSEENQGRDVVLGFIHDKANKRVGMRVLNRVANKVQPVGNVDDMCAWNLNINQGKFYPKCCKLSDFPVLALPTGVEGNPLAPDAKLTSKVSGAWVLEEVEEGKYRLVSVSGQTKDVTEATAITFHTNYKIANATLDNGKLTGMFKKFVQDFGADVFTLHEDGQVKWYYYNPDGNDGEGQYVENNFDKDLILKASSAKTAEEFFDFIGSACTQYLIDNEGDAEFEELRKSVTTDKFDLTGCTAETMRALKEFAAAKVTKGDELNTHRFFLASEKLQSNGILVMWLSHTADDKGKCRYDLTYISKKSITSASKKSKVYVDFFEALEGAEKGGGYFIEGDKNYAVLDQLFNIGEVKWEGLSDETMEALIAFADAHTAPDANKVDTDYGKDVFTLHEDGSVQWIYYNPAGFGGKGQYAVKNLGIAEINEVRSSRKLDSFFASLSVRARGSFIDNDGSDEFERTRVSVATEKFDLVGLSEATKKALVAFADKSKTTKPTIDKSADIEKMKAINDELKAASEVYYGEEDGEESPLSDLEYDQKYDELRALEIKTGVILPDSVTQGVGTEVKGKLPKVTHAEKLLSLDKSKEIGALKGLLQQDPEGEHGVLSWKKDGLTILATYDGGVLKQAVTRGNGKVGEDVTHNAKFFKGMPRRIPYTGELRIRGEAVIAYSTFERINAELPEGQEPYKNPRNLASGMVRRSEVTKDGSVEFFPFGVVATDPKYKFTIYSQSLKFLASQGFTPVESKACIVENIESVVENFKKKIETFDYPTDGLVLAIDDLSVQAKLGSTGHHPKGAIAFKWADEKQKTTLSSILWSASRTGVLTPVAIFEPVELEGTTVKRASVHNLTMLRKLKLGIGDTISIYKANMIIPQIAENHTCSDTVQAPKNCPICGVATSIRVSNTKGEASEFVICPNPDCAAKNVKGLAHFVKREAMNIDGISEKTVQELLSAGFIRSALDFYTVKDHPEIADLPNWGKSSYNKLVYAIDTSRTTTLPQVIYSLGIKNVGRSASETLANYYKDIEVLMGDMEQSQEDADKSLSHVDGIGPIMRGDIIAYFKANKDYVEKLVSHLTIGSGTGKKALVLPSNVPQGAPNCLDGLSFCVTGKIEFEGARDALHAYIESLGGKAVSAVSKSTNYLITNTPNSGSSKNKKAQDLGCKVISEASLFTLVKDLSEKAVVSDTADGFQDGDIVSKGNNAKYAWEISVDFVSNDAVFHVYIEDLAVQDYVVNGREFLDLDSAVDYLTKYVSGDKPTLTQGEQIVQQMIDSVVIPEDPREARIQAAETIQILSGVPLAGLTICVTGKVNYGTRDDLHRFIISKGGQIATSVTRGVDYLITNDAYSGSVKNKKAEALGARVISERDFMIMANK